MKLQDIHLGRGVLICCNFIFLACGVSIVCFGGLLLTDEHRVLLSRLLGPSHSLPHPVFYYIALGLMAAGIAVCSTGVLGCWASCGGSGGLLGAYLFLIVVLLLAESTLGALVAVCPQYLGIGISLSHVLEMLQHNYGAPGKDQITAAVDLAQTEMECCGVRGAQDYESSWWRQKEIGQRDLQVPLTCCLTNKTKEEKYAFLDPQPLNITLCQATKEAVFKGGRHIEGCLPKLELWFQENRNMFLALSLGLVLVELSSLLSAILTCVKVPQRTGAENL